MLPYAGFAFLAQTTLRRISVVETPALRAGKRQAPPAGVLITPAMRHFAGGTLSLRFAPIQIFWLRGCRCLSIYSCCAGWFGSARPASTTSPTAPLVPGRAFSRGRRRARIIDPGPLPHPGTASPYAAFRYDSGGRHRMPRAVHEPGTLGVSLGATGRGGSGSPESPAVISLPRDFALANSMKGARDLEAPVLILLMGAPSYGCCKALVDSESQAPCSRKR